MMNEKYTIFFINRNTLFDSHMLNLSTTMMASEVPPAFTTLPKPARPSQFGRMRRAVETLRRKY